MLATWLGTQADDSFPDAWKTDTVGANANSRSKVYQSPKLWYLRSTDISMLNLKESSFQLKAQLGFQVQKTKQVSGAPPSWNEDLMFVAAEPFTAENDLVFVLIEHRPPKEQAIVGVTRVPLEDPNEEKRVYRGRVHLRLCFDGGYHANDLQPMKTINAKGSTDAYAVAKYGNKWVRTRTISDSLEPRWNEQYTWRVYDPSTVLTIGVLDSWEAVESEASLRPDFRIGKVRIRISTLTTGKVYRSVFPLMLLSQAGLKKMGKIELAVRFVRSTPTLDFLHVYSQPLLPAMHHLKPLGMLQQEALRSAAVKIVAAHLSRSEPPLRREVVNHVLEQDGVQDHKGDGRGGRGVPLGGGHALLEESNSHRPHPRAYGDSGVVPRPNSPHAGVLRVRGGTTGGACEVRQGARVQTMLGERVQALVGDGDIRGVLFRFGVGVVYGAVEDGGNGVGFLLSYIQGQNAVACSQLLPPTAFSLRSYALTNYLILE
ncbi:hypothetical protein SASPL_108491 [Salvia splendens]|uniref:C2 domain-containing protein n=1 Tax=Salvia splendens TaxID=180675 RepID=A0A8X8YCD2_SALSN|nr:hypothetical protein SASPL_108491 [Salvia splendens]